jgi:hypothetical protein
MKGKIMAAKNSKKNLNSKKSDAVIQRPDTNPLNVGRVTRHRMNNGDGRGLVALVGFVWAKYEAQLSLGDSATAYLDGRNNRMVLTPAVKKEIDTLLGCISFSERSMSDDESFGVYICNLIRKSVCKHLGMFCVEF